MKNYLTKNLLLTLTLLSGLTIINMPAHASAQNSLAKADTETKALEAASKIQKACDNTELTINIDWTKFDSYDYESHKLTQSNVMKNFGGVIGSYASYISYLCDTEAYAGTYKPLIQALTAINFQVTDTIKPENYKEQVTASSDGTTLTIITRPNNLAASHEKEIIDLAF